MFDGIAEHEGRKTELANAIIFLRNCLLFLLCLFNLFLFNDLIINVKSCFDALLFYNISRTRTAYRFAPWSTRLLYLFFIWNPKTLLRMWPSDSGVGLRMRRSWVRPPSPTIFFLCHIFFLITIFYKYSDRFYLSFL